MQLASEAEKLDEANLTTSSKVFMFYKANKDKIDACAMPLLAISGENDRYDKLGNEVKVSKEWIKLGEY